MLDKVILLEMLGDLKEIAAIQENVLSQEEIRGYFDEMELNEEHFKHIYTYLAQNQITVHGFAAPETKKEAVLKKEKELVLKKEKESFKEEKKSLKEEKELLKEEKKSFEEDVISLKEEGEPLKEEDSIFLKMYLKDLKTLSKHSKEEEDLLFIDIRKQKAEAKEKIIEIWLPKVVLISKRYKNHGMSLEDLIQEGNIGLLGAMERLSSLEDIKDMEQYLRNNISQAMEQAIKNYSGENVLENTLVGRSNLIHEAANYLAEDLGRVATLFELADYTKLSEEEIKDIRALSLDSIELGEGE